MLGLTLFLLLLLPAFSQKKPITLESLHESARRGDAPGPPNWAPDGKTFVFRQRNNLVIYDPGTQNSRVLAATEPMDDAAVTAPEEGPYQWQDRYVHESTLQWTPSGKQLLYLSGGDLFLIHVDTGKWDQITKTPVAEHDPKISPDGKRISFRRDWDLYTLELATGHETRLTTNGSATLRNGGLDWVYPEEIGLNTAHWWSPDSQSIAYLQFDLSREPLFPHEDLLKPKALFEPERYPQAGDNNADVHVGVVSATGGPSKWLEVGDTRRASIIARAGWMPDSKGVYVARTNRVQNRLELLSIDLESGTPSTILRETDPHWINLEGDVHFLKDGKRFIWSSERDGYRHLYLYSNDGSSVKPLTKGTWEVRDLAGVDETNGRVFFTSNEASPFETHLYSVRLNGDDKRRLDAAPGVHRVSVAPGGSYYLDTYSSETSPPRTTLHTGGGRELGVYREADRSVMEEYDVLPAETVSFKGADGTPLYGRLIKPAGFQAGKKYPVIVNVYGGPGVALPVRNSWGGANLDQVYAHKGYVVWQAENRGGTGRGHAFETSIYHNLGVAELADQVAGVKHLITMGFADPQRVGIRGWSYGGFMTLNALLNAPDVFRCGIAGAPVTNWLNYDTIYTERYMGLPDEDAEAYQKTALPQHAANLKAKLMIVHNFEDDNVLFQNTMQMVDALEREGKEFEFMLYPQKTHGVSGAASRQMDASMLDFFERNLKP